MVVRGGFGPPVFTAWVTGLQPAAFNRFAYLTLARLRSVREAGFGPATTALTVRRCTTQLLPNRTRFRVHHIIANCQRSKTEDRSCFRGAGPCLLYFQLQSRRPRSPGYCQGSSTSRTAATSRSPNEGRARNSMTGCESCASDCLSVSDGAYYSTKFDWLSTGHFETDDCRTHLCKEAPVEPHPAVNGDRNAAV